MGHRPSNLGFFVAFCLNVARLVAAQNGDGGAASGNIMGSNGAGGNAGPSQSSANLSIGATIAIAIIVGIVAITGVVTAYLFYSAKKRQWTVRDQLRHSRRRVTTGLKAIAAPLTPGRGILSPVKTRFNANETAGLRDDPSHPSQSKPSRNFSRKNKGLTEEDTQALRGRDLEKGESVVTNTKSSSTPGHVGADRSKASRDKMKIDIPQKSTNMSESPQTPMWNKFLGRT